MQNYSVLPPSYSSNWQSIVKYCLDLDKQIIAVQNFIDFSNPNRIILNYRQNADDSYFYTTNDLYTLKILCHRFDHYDYYQDMPELIDHADDLHVGQKVVVGSELIKITSITLLPEHNITYEVIEEENSIGINLDQMWPGEVIYNSFGDKIVLFLSIKDEDPAVTDIAEGMSVLRLSSENQYQLLALDSEGDFYVVSDILTNGDMIFSILPKATISYGLYYWFSLCGQNARWIYRNQEVVTTGETVYKPTNWQGFTLSSWYWGDDSRVYVITTPYNTLWPINSVISHEFLVKKTNNYQEEVFCEESFEIYSQAVDRGAKSFYTITTNMNDDVSDTTNMRVNLY